MHQHIALNVCCLKGKVATIAYVPSCKGMLYMYIMMFNLFDSYVLKAFAANLGVFVFVCIWN